MVLDQVVYLIGKTSIELRDPDTLEVKHRVEGAGETAFLASRPTANGSRSVTKRICES